MKRFLFIILFIVLTGISACKTNSEPKLDGASSITVQELEKHLYYLASDEFQGRNTPSPQLNEAARYLAEELKRYGLKPAGPDSSYYQSIILATQLVSEKNTHVKLKRNGKEENFNFLADFGIESSELQSGSQSGKIVFLGLGFRSGDGIWDDYNKMAIRDNIAVILDANLPDSHELRNQHYSAAYRARADSLVKMGARAVIKIIDDKRETSFQINNHEFVNQLQSKVINQSEATYYERLSHNNLTLEVRHDMASKILNISQKELNVMMEAVKSGFQVSSKLVDGILKIDVDVITDEVTTKNVLGLLEGTDPVKKNEYVVIGAHYDHIGITESGVYNGANDNGSGTVGLLELAQALVLENPSRSIIFAWFTGEEKGLWGSSYFVDNPPVPLEQISACINLDVLSGEELQKVTVTGGNQLSSTLESMINQSAQAAQMELDYIKDNPGLASFFFVRSDHFPFIKNGIPAVWFGAHSDQQEHIHRISDDPENIYYEKIQNITRLSYDLVLHIANHKDLLPLDKNLKVTKRGKHNLKLGLAEIYTP